MKNLCLFVFILLTTYCHSQISFEKGYFIDNLNEKTECLIKNIAWKNNPTELEYKLSENGQVNVKTIRYVKEFGIYDKSKYTRYQVDIDRSSTALSNLSTDRRPEFKEERLFLKVLVEGDATLFLYEDGSLRRFFYSFENSEVEQLVYKNYKSADFQVKENTEYMN